ncbi:MAG: hypothetical protein OQK29_01380 [Ignavibacteriaceae bacterium]|nr:hypothetical protein [Ignavibacteriaceae bacterium]
MKAETFVNKMNAKTANWNGLGGGGFDALIQGDLGAVMMACQADPLTWAYLFSYHDIGSSYDKYTEQIVIEQHKGRAVEYKSYKRVHVSQSFNEFKNMLKDWIFSNYLQWRINKGDEMLKALERATNAVDDISHGLAVYLSKDPKNETRIAPYFKPMHHEKFKRNYRSFSIKASRHLFNRLVKLCQQIEEFVQNDENI